MAVVMAPALVALYLQRRAQAGAACDEEECLCVLGAGLCPRHRQRARVRIFRPCVSLFGMSNDNVRRHFRFPPHLIIWKLWELCDLEGNLGTHTAIPPLTIIGGVTILCLWVIPEGHGICNGNVPVFLQQNAEGCTEGVPDDSTYPLRPFLLTSVLTPSTEHSVAYNQSFTATRQVVERAIGELKGHFRCLDRSGGALMYSAVTVCDIVVLCCIFHNIVVRNGVSFEVGADADAIIDAEVAEQHPSSSSSQVTSSFRDYVIETYF